MKKRFVGLRPRTLHGWPGQAGRWANGGATRPISLDRGLIRKSVQRPGVRHIPKPGLIAIERHCPVVLLYFQPSTSTQG